MLAVALFAAVVGLVTPPASAAARPAAAVAAGSQVLGWGYNQQFNLGDGTSDNRLSPVQTLLPAGTVVTDVAAGRGHGLALTSTGWVYAWGYNNYGQVGDGTTTNRALPVRVLMPAGVVVTKIAASGWDSLALTSTGQVYSWGDNRYAQLGNGTLTASSVPVPVALPAGTTVTDIAMGVYHSLVLTSTGQILAWGLNQLGEVGDGTTTTRTRPVQVLMPDGYTVTKIAAGGSSSMAAVSSGGAFAWGNNASGQLGFGSAGPYYTRPLRVQLPVVAPLIDIAMGSGGLAVTITGEVYGWGDNANGQVGDGTTTQRNAPVRVLLPEGVKATSVSAGNWHSVATTSLGWVYTWGGNFNGELGDGTTTQRNTPVRALLPEGFNGAVVAAGGQGALDGGDFTLAVAAPETALGWGADTSGQLGNGSTTDTPTPVQVTLPAGVALTSVEAGYSHTVAATRTGAVYAWGSNTAGQLGTGDTTDHTTPTLVLMPAGTTATAVAGGQFHSLALTDDGRVFAWGRNTSGQLGDGTTTNRLTPVQVSFPAGTVITAIATHNVHNIALTSTGQVYTWGDNTYGQIGDGTTGNTRKTPTLIALPGTATATSVAAGAFHTLAVTSTGTAYAWGYNAYGQLGTGNYDNSSTPVPVWLPSGTTLIEVDAGLSFSLAITTTGRALSWGAGTTGQLGINTLANNSFPVWVLLPAGVLLTAIAGGQSHALALTTDHRILVWGLNNRGQLGDGTTTTRLAPRYISPPAGITINSLAAGQFFSIVR
ncbi:RCC1 domain-containing protein [Micromonospora sp. HUAS LYJ1]|uniref:RCC1-like domain-containing protein n=1 Tax=Micromonospora sp. HUAS LYJ1 TaxID=3061626 RepID=UPI002671507D|nr:RCC1 domain-containing protein [Micromonospora sp. HUAS LYJ1]WKU07124.1 cell wall anchor protein [Micromonospora sp. HUAS LYJ1]